MPKKMYVGVDNFTQRTLPSAYTQLAYIETDGASHIDTGITPDQNTRIDMDFEILSTTVNPSVLFGVRTSSGGTPYFGVVYLGTYLRFDYGTAQKTLTPSSLTSRVNLSVNKNVFSFGSSSVTNTENTFTCGNTMFLFSYSNGGTQNSPVKARLYSCQIYDNGTLVRDYIPAESSGGVIGLYDAVSGGFSRNGGSGAFTAGPTYKGVARQVKKGYFGVDGVARKVKKGYIGVGGVARPFFGGGELTYYGTATALSVARGELAATTIGDYALFAGGYSANYDDATVDAYNASLTRSTPTALSYRRECLSAAAVGDYALFAGGLKSTSTQSLVNAYNKKLTRSTPTSLAKERQGAAGAAIGDYALFVGGATTSSSGNTGSKYVDAYNTSLTRSTLTNLTEYLFRCAGVTVGNYAVFGGGGTYSYINPEDYGQQAVYAYDASLTRTTPTMLSVRHAYAGGAAVGDYALIAGGSLNETTDVVEAYNTSLTRSLPTVLSVSRGNISASSVGGFAIFAGGENASTSAIYDVVDVYDASLTRTVSTSMSCKRTDFAATTIGNYALFAGGYNSRSGRATAGKYATVDVYTVV